MAHPGGRPSVYTTELAEKICLDISTSSKSIEKICRDNPDYPVARTIWFWRLTNPEFFQLYTKAREARCEVYVDEIIDIADDTANDNIVNASGNVVANNEYINRSRLKIETRKWVAAKLASKIYGDKLVQENKQDQEQFDKVLQAQNQQLQDEIKRIESAYQARLDELKKSYEKDL